MRIGELLHRDGLVGAEDLASALADQQTTGMRLCSLLVVRGVIDADQAARVLAELHGVSAALMKHINHRDKALAKLVPANLARQYVAIPLGRLRDGEIVVCVRDPKPHLQSVFERIVEKPVLITVACAHVLEPLIDATYPPVVTQDFYTRFGTPVNQPPPPSSFAEGTLRESDGVVEEFDVDLDSGSTPIDVPVVTDGMPEVFSLVDLDDARVSKDFAQPFDTKTLTSLPPGAGAASRGPTLPPPNVTRTPAKK